MNQPAAKTKDRWDKLDVAGKLLSGVLLAVIAVVLERGSAKISQSMQTAQLVQSLISDLAAPDTTIRQEIALAALNRAVWDQNPELVWDVCERILTNSQYLDVTRDYAFQVVFERDSTRAKGLLAARGSSDLVRTTADSIAGDTTPQGMTLSRVPDPLTQRLLSRYLQKVVYIQYHGRGAQDIAQGLRRRLIDDGFTSPDGERVDPRVNRVYYFYSEDSAAAYHLADITRSYFANARVNASLPDEIKVRNLAGKYSAPEGQLEVWISPVTTGTDPASRR